MSSKQNHRIPTKQTPFTSGGNGGGNNDTTIRSSSHSQNQRTIMTKTIRKAKRGQVVARKRHLYNFASGGGGTVGGGVESTVGSGIGGIANSSSMGAEMSMDINPYSRDAQNVQRAIQLSRNVVRLCLQQWQEKNNNHQQHQQHQQQLQQHEAELATTLDQLCILLTPDDNDINPSSSGTTRQQQQQQQQQQGVSYDSSMAGMAANSILAQFEDSVIDYSNNSNNSNNLAVLLASSLGYILSSSYNGHSNTNNDNIVQIKAAIVLNQLAATDPPPPPSSALQYQIQLVESSSTTATATATTREIPTSWCHVIVNSKDLLLSLLRQLPSSPSSSASCINLSSNNNSSGSIALAEKSISIIGNLLGDSYVAHSTLLQMNVVSKLIGCVQFGLGVLNHVTTTATTATANTTDMAASSGVMLQTISILQLVRNSVWSLINVIRGGNGGGEGGESSKTSSSLMKDIIQGINLEVLLSLPESIQSILNTNTDSNNNVGSIRASFDVAIETCWLIVFLTNRNDDTSSTSITLFGFEIVSGLLKRLCTCTVAATKRFRQQSTSVCYSSFHQNTSYDDDELSQSLSNGSIPCCRAFTNIAIYLDYCSTSIDIDTAYEDAMAAREVKDNFNGILLSEMTTRCLVELISLGSIGGGNEASTIACSATVLAGIFLVDGSREMNKNHHYQEEQQQQHSAVAAVVVKTLLPALIEGLISPLSTYDFKREVVWALWNMFQNNNHLQDDTRLLLLNEILNHRLEPERVAKSLTGMLTALESSDAVEPCLGLIDMILRERKLPDPTGRSIKVLFEEVGLVDALWYICDNDVDESDVAEKSAELIDDFYEEQEEDEAGEDVNGMMTVPSVNDGQFQFQAPQPNSGQFFNFTN
jgi:hypothetical protein